jgi:acyl-CoA synthetase (AMP-forming)/AMP-acid ligase II
MNHPAIAQVAIVGQSDERMGEVGHAFVVLRHDQRVTADDLLNWARNRMANFKVPRQITFVEVLPTNASGKVLKFELRQTFD